MTEQSTHSICFRLKVSQSFPFISPSSLPIPPLDKSHLVDGIERSRASSYVPRDGLSSIEPGKAYHSLSWNIPSLLLPQGSVHGSCPSFIPLWWYLSVQYLYGFPLGFWRAGNPPRNRMQAKKTSNILSWLLGGQLLKIQFVSIINRISSLAKAGSQGNIWWGRKWAATCRVSGTVGTFLGSTETHS